MTLKTITVVAVGLLLAVAVVAFCLFDARAGRRSDLERKVNANRLKRGWRDPLPSSPDSLETALQLIMIISGAIGATLAILSLFFLLKPRRTFLYEAELENRGRKQPRDENGPEADLQSPRKRPAPDNEEHFQE
jgi:hypothetical protein